MRAPERVPDPLKQKFFPSNDGFEIEYAKLIHTQDDGDLTVKHLMDCTGEFTKLIALYCGNSLVIRQLRDGGMQAPFIFGEDLVVQDVDYLRSTDGGFEIVVGLNSEKPNIHPNCVALLSWNGAKLVLLRKLKIEEEVLVFCFPVTSFIFHYFWILLFSFSLHRWIFLLDVCCFPA
ncbi:unnamed protein product [Cylicostephanus goldi]|uniref:Uncharacterized protein n=1 Tax=Cylicostephanus goldi TaxID=71465 RepID=A0A3P6R7W1_CYLGO|nr:unnamed protein product [Cylicostephanus goldi]